VARAACLSQLDDLDSYFRTRMALEADLLHIASLLERDRCLQATDSLCNLGRTEDTGTLDGDPGAADSFAPGASPQMDYLRSCHVWVCPRTGKTVPGEAEKA
jgi:hypothetical protein